MSDLISRQAAIDAVNSLTYPSSLMDVKRKLMLLPPAKPKRMRATWISKVALQDGQITLRDYKCSNCSHHRGKPMNFCEVCGAKMEENNEID